MAPRLHGDDGGAPRGGVSLLWPLPEGASTTSLPEAFAERLLGEDLKDSWRALRSVSRSARAAVDARVRSLSVHEYDLEKRPGSPAPATPLELFERFGGSLEKVAVDLGYDRTDLRCLELVTHGLPLLARVKELSVTNKDDIDEPVAPKSVAAFARALPATLEVLHAVIDTLAGGIAAIVEASGGMPALRVLRAYALQYDMGPEAAAAVRRVLRRPGAWSNLRVRARS